MVYEIITEIYGSEFIFEEYKLIKEQSFNIKGISLLRRKSIIQLL
jgi:hypothetical protein